MEVVNEAFREIREMLKSTVPPCTATVDNNERYEVWAVKEDSGISQVSRVLLGNVTRHSDSVTVGFNNKIGEKQKKELFSAYLLQKMNPHGRISIHQMNHQLHTDIQSAIDALMRYYTDMNWI